MKLPEPEANYKRAPKGEDEAVVFGELLSLCFWDLWCLLAVREKFSGNFKSARDYFEQMLKNNSLWSLHVHHDQIRDLHHLVGNLEVRMQKFVGVSVLDKVPERLIKKEMPKVKTQIMEAGSAHSPSEEMLKAPYRELKTEAYYGQWENLLVNPYSYATQLASIFQPKAKLGYIPSGSTFKLARKIEKKIAKTIATIDKNPQAKAHRYALYRSLLSLYQELNCWDDSYGDMGELGQVWMKALLLETPRSLQCNTDIFLKDLLMFCCWEGYGLVSTEQVVSYINSKLNSQEQVVAVTILEEIASRATEAFCKYHADTAFRILEKLGPGDNVLRHLRVVEMATRD